MTAREELSWISEDEEIFWADMIDCPFQRGAYELCDVGMVRYPDTRELVQVEFRTEDYADDTGTQYRCVPLAHGCARAA